MKKLVSFLLVVLMVVSCVASFTACGEKAEDGDVLKIGGIGPLTGLYATYGISVKEGAELAVEEINKNGGVNGFTFALEFLDSEADGDKAVTAYGKLLDNGIKVSLGGTLSGETASVAAVNEENGLFLLTPSASSKSAIEGFEHAFRVCFNDPNQGIAAAQYINDHNLAKKVAILYESDIDYSTGIVNKFKETITANSLNFEVVKEVYFTSGAVDFSTQIDAIISSGAEFVFLPIYAAECSVFLTQVQEHEELKNVTFFGCDGLDGVLGELDDHPEYANGVMLLTPFSADSEEEHVKNFVKAFAEKYNNAVPDQFAADGYDAVYAIAEAIKVADVKASDNISAADLGDKLVSAFQTVTVKGVTGNMTWSADGETTKDAKAVVIDNGTYVLYKD